jgi:hypothetical protein
MGRPKGSKNKPKIPLVVTDNTVTVIEPPKAAKPAVKETTVVAPKQHIVFQFADYAIERMDGIEIDAQRRAAKKADRPLKYWVAKSLMDFFRLHDPTLDLSVLLKESK